MPTCPNCGSYVPLGNHSCSCGTTIRYDDEYDDSGYSIVEQMMDRERLMQENPYDEDFFNELHHQQASPIMIEHMDDGISYLKKKFNATLDDVTVMGNVAIFKLKVEDKYYDATFRATYDMTNSFGSVELLKETVTPDFTRLYHDMEFKKIITEKENEMGFEFRFCKLAIIGDAFLIDAHFENRSYLVDLDEMILLE